MPASVPFVANPNNRCVPATIGMILAHFMPELHFTMPELERLTGYQPGKGTWQTQSMLSLAGLGFELEWIEDFDWPRFAREPESYLKSILSPEAFRWQLENGDLPGAAAEWQKYRSLGLPFTQRKGTVADIKRLLDKGWLVRLEVNAQPLADKPGYDGHSVLVIGYNQDGVILHNPDGANGNRPNQHVDWQLLDAAWGGFGGSYALYGFYKSKVE
ncbi:MAG TPA: hypothetical protein VLF91_02040 [Candidatus Saccharimonadales bacterium]|nr:hypothetical protein [Candidatus Saccharimonadales bacterium]